MINIAICDDSRTDALDLQSICESCDLGDNVSIAVYESSEALISVFDTQTPDIVFLDVEMPDGNGISIGKQIRESSKKVLIIFFTNYPQYAIEAYDCEAFHYLLKPCKPEKVQEVLLRAVRKLGHMHTYHTVKIQNKILRLLISDVYYVEYCRKHVIYHTENEQYETTGKLFETYGELKEYGFYQVHQGYIVNLAHVRDFQGFTAILDNGAEVPISVRKKSDVLLAYAKYVEENI